MESIFKNTKLIHILIIALITSIVYLNSFKNGFAYDDHTHILNNNEIRHFSNIPRFFMSSSQGIYRPFRNIHYMALYAVSGENPIGYHINSLLFHLLNTVLVYFIVNLLIGKRNISFIASLIFGLHPIHTERVTNLTAGFDQLGIFFMLLAVYLYILYSRSKKNGLYIGSLISFTAALFSTEEAIILPMLVLLYEACFNSESIKKSLMGCIWFFILGIAFVILRFFVLKIGARANEYIAGSLFYTMLTMSKVFAGYIVLLFAPFNLTLYRNVAISKSLLDGYFMLSLSFLALIILWAIKAYNTKREVTFAIGWFFIALIPFSNVIPIATLMAERYLYAPSFAFSLLAALFIDQLYNINKSTKALAFFILALLVISYSTAIIKRNAEWRDDLTLWTATIKKSPSSSEAYDNLGFAYERKGMIDRSIESFKAAIRLNPSNYKAYANLGTSYARKGNFTLAELYLKKSIVINPEHYKAYNYLGLIYAQNGLFNESIRMFKSAITANPDFDEAYYNIGAVYEYIGEHKLARQSFENAYRLNPKDVMYIKRAGEQTT